MNNIWKEIRINHIDEENSFWSVDAWKTDDDCEEGKVIAYIDNLTGRVIYADPLARVDKMAQEEIAAKVAEIKSRFPVLLKDEQGTLTMYFETKAGLLVAQLERDEVTGAGYDGVFVGIHPTGKEDSYLDLVSARAITDERVAVAGGNDFYLQLNAWSNPYSEDTTYSETITDEVLNDALNEYYKESEDENS